MADGVGPAGRDGRGHRAQDTVNRNIAINAWRIHGIRLLALGLVAEMVDDNVQQETHHSPRCD